MLMHLSSQCEFMHFLKFLGRCFHYRCALYLLNTTPLHYLYVFSMAIWRYTTSMAISQCLFYGNIALSLIWKYLCCYEQYQFASAKYIILLLPRNLLWKYLFASVLNVFFFCKQYLFTSASYISLLLRVISLYF